MKSDKIIKFKTSKLAKEKGFTYAYEFYDKKGRLEDFGMVGGYANCHTNNYPAPTQSLLQQNLMKEKIIVWCEPIESENEGVLWTAKLINSSKSMNIIDLNLRLSYSKSLEIGLQEALKLI